MVVFKNRLAIGDYRSNVLFIMLQIEVFLLGKVSLATSVNHSDFLLFFLGLLPFIKILYSISINIHPTTTHCTFPIHPSHLTPPHQPCISSPPSSPSSSTPSQPTPKWNSCSPTTPKTPTAPNTSHPAVPNRNPSRPTATGSASRSRMR